MKKTLSIIFFATLYLAVCHHPAPAIGETLRFDADGLAINEEQYEQNTADRDKNLSMELAEGYHAGFDNWKDPIKTRKKRMAQWKEMRAKYNPDSLPHKIEDAKDKQ